MTVITHASTDEQLRQILELQRRYHLRATPAEAQTAEGFVYAEHTLSLLQRMAAASPQAIALTADRVVGYWTTRADADPTLRERTSGVYWRAQQGDAELLDSGDDRQRARLIALRIKQWKALTKV